MIATQTAMGAMIVGLCLFGIWHRDWMLVNSRYGRRLVIWFGPEGGRRALISFLLLGVVFGILLAADVVRPMHWNKL
jgi:hypothetical protein